MIRNWIAFLKKMPSLLFGLFLFSAGIVSNLYSEMGMMPWGVLNVGITNQTTMTLGQASQLVGFIVLVLGWFLGFAPGFGTVANIYFIGLFIDLIIAWELLPTPSNLPGKMGMLFLSIGLIGIGSFFYMRVRLGAGPRDGLMMGLVKKLNRPVSFIRGVIEITVLVIGYLLGGPVGLGTVVTAISVGLSVQLAFRIGRYDKGLEHTNLMQLLSFLSGKGSLH